MVFSVRGRTAVSAANATLFCVGVAVATRAAACADACTPRPAALDAFAIAHVRLAPGSAIHQDSVVLRILVLHVREL